jgi:predicted nicotinamide N-methyase
MSEQMSLVDIMGELQNRGIDFTGIFDKAVLLQLLVDARVTEKPAPELGPEPEPQLTTLEPEPEPEPELATPRDGEEVLQIELAGHSVRMQVRSVMGLSIWAAASAAAERAVEMLSTLGNQTPTVDRAPVALEVGAGGALPSLLAAAAGQQVLATDGDTDVVALVRRNFALNGLNAVGGTSGKESFQPLAPRKLDWTDTADLDSVLADWPRGFPLIIAADVFWNCDSMEQFLASVPKLLDRTRWCPPPSLLLAMSDDLFLDLTRHTITTAALHGLRLVARERVTGPSVATSAYGTVLREDSSATLLTFHLDHIGGNTAMANSAQQKQVRQTSLAARENESSTSR